MFFRRENIEKDNMPSEEIPPTPDTERSQTQSPRCSYLFLKLLSGHWLVED